MAERTDTKRRTTITRRNKQSVIAHGHEGHYATCSSCGWIGEEKELPADPKGHPCGKDECPECKTEGNIVCCYKSYEGAEREDEGDIDVKE